MLQSIIRYSRVFFILAVLITFSVIIIFGINIYQGTKAKEEQELLNRAETIAQLLEPKEIVFLKGDGSDADNPFYVSLKNQFKKIKETNPDMQVLRIYGENNNGIFSYLSSDETERTSESLSLNQSEIEAGKKAKEVFETGFSSFYGPINENSGKWITVFIPLRHPETEKIVTVLSMKISASSYFLNIILSVLNPTLFIMLLFIILLTTLLTYKKEKGIILFKEELISIVSHDLRSPLTGLSWSVQGLLKNKDFQQYPDNTKETLVMMDKTLQGLLTIVADILNISQLGKISSLNMQGPVDLCHVVDESINLLTFFAKEKGVAIQKNGEWPKKAMITGHEEKLKRAISNIIGNGVKYSPNNEVVYIGYQKEEKKHVISIENYGELIPKTAQNKIFTKFFRANKAETLSQPGTGLGLYFAKQIIEAHKGKVWFKSEKNNKTIFFVALPIATNLEIKA